MKLDDDININYRIGSPSEEWIKKEADGIHAMGYREGYKQAESDYKKKIDDIKEVNYWNRCKGFTWNECLHYQKESTDANSN